LLLGCPLEQYGAVSEEFVKKIVAIIYKPAHDLHGSRILILDVLKPSLVKRDDLCVRIAQQNRRMAGNDELRISSLSQNVMEENQKS
jgi:hypothetical protein